MGNASLGGNRWLTLPLIGVVVLLLSVVASPLVAQGTGSVQGTVTRADDGAPLPGVTVTIEGTRLSAWTDQNGRYVLRRVPAGLRTILIRRLGFRSYETAVNVVAGVTHTQDAALASEAIRLGELVVTAASLAPERVVEAPAAVSIVDRALARDLSLTAEAPRALAHLPGVDVVQNDGNDYNVNARGFNASFARRMLVLLDGRDLAFSFLGLPAWGVQNLLNDMRQIEVVRGPGSALYGANAYSGVISFTTLSAREAVGTRLTLGGGELSMLSGDLRHAGVTSEGRFGYKVNVGYNRSDLWSVARTTSDGGDMRREYGQATDYAVPDLIEAFPLFGQELDPLTREAVGEPDPMVNMYGSARLDYYRDDGSVVTVEGGHGVTENQVWVSPLGRNQGDKITRPWVRAAWAADRFNLMLWYGSEDFVRPTRGMGSAAFYHNVSSTVHAEAQYNRPLLSGRGRMVVGASARSLSTNTKGTVLAAESDDRRDRFYAAYGQFELELAPHVRVVGAARFDTGDLFDAQFSPRGAIVYEPAEQHAVRFTVSRAFQSPSQTQFFAGAIAGAPADFSALEAGLRASPLGPALAGVLDGDLFTNSSAVPILLLGNDELKVEKVTSLELGYKGQISERVFLTIDGYYSRSTDFVTEMLPGVNPAYAPWTAPEVVPEELRATLEQTVRDQLLAGGQPFAAAGLTRLGNGNTAIVASFTNFGKVNEYGVEVGVGVSVTPEIQLDGNYTLFEFAIDSTSLLPGVELLPNTPMHKVNLSASYTGRQGFDVRMGARFVDSYDWASGLFAGRIPSSQTVDISAGYRINRYTRVHVIATNVLDQRRYHMYGGAVIGRRVLGGMTVTF